MTEAREPQHLQQPLALLQPLAVQLLPMPELAQLHRRFS